MGHYLGELVRDTDIYLKKGGERNISLSIVSFRRELSLCSQMLQL